MTNGPDRVNGADRADRADAHGFRVLALYVGGFLGPFGGGVVSSMLPEMGNDLGVTAQTASITLTAYLLPFAAVMLVSGTLGARWGRMRTVRIAYILYLLASVICALGPNLETVLVGRMLQGCANAFTSPLLLASLALITPREKLGRVLGTFGALQAAGTTVAPLVGGIAAEFDWRLAFWVLAAASAVLGAAGLPVITTAGRTDQPPPRLRDALTTRVLRIGVVALLGWGALGGLGFLVAYRAQDAFALSPSERGLLLTGFGVAGVLAARPVGSLIDLIGSTRTVIVGALCGATLVGVAGTVNVLAMVAVAWMLAGIASQFVLVGVNAAVLAGGSANSGGSVSVVQAFRFGGAALSPLALTPLYGVHPSTAFLVPAVALALLAPALMPRTEHAGRRGVSSGS